MLWALAQAGMALSRATTPGPHVVQLAGFMGMIWATIIFMFGLFARIWLTSVV